MDTLFAARRRVGWAAHGARAGVGRWIGSGALLLAGLALSGCATLKTSQVEVVWAGIFEGPPSRAVLVERTTRIPARPGVRFGVQVIVHGPAPSVVYLNHITRYPAPGRRVPGREHLVLASESGSRCQPEVPCTIGYSADAPDEMMPGTWRLELYSDNSKVLEQAFTMVAAPSPPPVPPAPAR